MADLIPFDFQGASVRVVLRDGDPWFVASDVCRVLELGNISQALTRLDDDERTLISTEGGPPAGSNVVSESGLFSLVLGSRKPEARAFKRWVTHEVLPSIRRTGGYQSDPMALLSDPGTLRTLLGSYAERLQNLEVERNQLAATVADAAPKVAIVDRIVECGDTLGFRTAAKLVHEATGANEGEFRSLLLRRSWIQRLDGRLLPAHVGTARGYVTVRDREWSDAEGGHHVKPELRITQKGLARAIALLLALEAA